jgi:hypothetical protein
MKIVSAYSLQRRSTDVLEEMCDYVLEQGKGSMQKVQLNILIRFFGACANLFTQPTEEP